MKTSSDHPFSDRWIKLNGVIVRGHGVASGQAEDPRFPGGTIVLQQPHFENAGLDLSGFHSATLNISIDPKRFEPRRALKTIRNVTWLEECPPEDFSFFNCRITVEDQLPVEGLVYYPHPETKPEHFQSDSTIEVLAPFIEGIEYGMAVVLELKEEEIAIV